MSDPWAAFPDAPAAAPAADPWGQFPDAPAAAPTQKPPASQVGNVIRQSLGLPPEPVEQPPVNTAKDVGLSVASGVPRGIANTLLFPIDLSRSVEAAGNWLYNKAENGVRYAIGADPLSEQELARREARTHESPAYAVEDYLRGTMNDYLHKPETRLGKVAGTVTEFAVPGSIMGKAGAVGSTGREIVKNGVENFVGNALIPGVASEVAGQATEGTPYEGLARFIGALGGNLATAAGRSYNAPESVVRRATGEMTDADWQRALDLQNNTTGIKLSGPESITQAKGGASALPNVQRVVEGSIEGRASTAPFYAQRPGQVDTAVGNVLDQIAPQSAQPSTLGPRAAEAAKSAISNTPQGQDLIAAITGAGPRTTALDAGTAIQEPLRAIFDRREGMRAALGDQDYAAARKAAPEIPVDQLKPETTTVRPAYTSIRPTAAEGEKVATSMTPVAVPAKTETPALTSATGAEAIQVDPRGVVKFIDTLAPTTKASARNALAQVRQSLFDKGGVDTSITGLDATRHQIGDMISVAKQSGENHTAAVLQQVQDKLDETLAAVPEYGRAKQNFAAASVPLAPFESPGMAKAIERDVYNKNFVTPPEDVPAAISSPSEARNFNAVAPTEARVAYENHLATQLLDKATGANGAVDPERLTLALRDNQDLLSQYPAVAERLNRIVSADAAVDRGGLVGDVAKATDTAGAGNAILPQNPLTGSAGEAADATSRLAAEDPATTSGLVRQNLADRYTKATTETQGANSERAGIKFHQDVAGNDTRQQVLDAVLRQLPGGQATVDRMGELLDVLQATGHRQAVGSATAFNHTLNEALGSASPAAAVFGLVKSLGTSLVTRAGDAVRRRSLQGNITTLADMFTDPHSVELIRDAIARGPKNTLPDAAMRSALESGGTIFDPAGRR